MLIESSYKESMVHHNMPSNYTTKFIKGPSILNYGSLWSGSMLINY
jgi:hypothetical protein